ncbi:hypothetical protein [Alicyclobacillus acidiphilus]|uniref:hypothetical protein n=1 Tax=Alicyclobacillus acidiphilus TaxID=182455 RepID=UPI00082A8493|nr:hypothetical protein [Alicyclobacillus acidiphilus]
MRAMRRDGRLPILGPLGLAVLLIAATSFSVNLFASESKSQASTSERQVHSTNEPRLSMSTAPFQWNDRPVFQVKNDSTQTLSHVFIQSWNNDILPVLAVGSQFPHPLPADGDPNPPYTLQPGASIWFVGEPNSDTEYVVNWLGANDRGEYEVLRANLDSSE